MMLSRRWPRPTPGPRWKPSESGPRCRMTPVIRLRRPGSTGCRGSVHTRPAMPHISGARPCVAPGRARRPLAHPELEANERPEPRRAVAPARVVDLEDPLDLGRPEDAALSRGTRQQDVARHVSKFAVEPATQRHPEAHLRPREDLGRKGPQHRPLE